MPTIRESELGGEAALCTECGEYEAALWLCGDGYLCEGCFARLADIPEEDLFATDEAGSLHPSEDQRSRVKTRLRLVGSDG